MQLPLHDTYLFISVPVLIGLSVSTFRSYKRTKNRTSLYISVASTLLAASLFFTGYPTLFFKEPAAVGVFGLLGDIFQALTLFVFWLLSINLIAPRNQAVKNSGYVVALLILIFSLVDAYYRNLSAPYGLQLSDLSASTYDIIITQTPRYILLQALGYLPAYILGVFFWTTSKNAVTPAQRIKIRSISVTFILGTTIFVAVPKLPINPYVDIKDVLLSTVYLLLGASLLLGLVNSAPKKV